MCSKEKNLDMSNHHIDGLMQERRNPIANALELRLSCTNLLIYAGSLLVYVTYFFSHEKINQ